MSKLKKHITKPWVVCLVAVICCALWGSAFPVIKIGYSLLGVLGDDYNSQILFAGIRFSLAGAFTLILGSAVSHKVLIVKRNSTHKIIILALFQTVLQYVFFYVGLASTTGTKSSILDSTSVFFSVIIASLILKKEHFTVKKLLGCVIGFLGVLVINLTSSGFDSSFSFFGEGFIILSALSYAISSVMIKEFSKQDNPVTLSGCQFVVGGLAMIVFALLSGGRLNFNFKSLLVVIYLALLSAVAYTLWGILLKYNDVSKVTVFGFMTPVFGCLLSAILLKESLNQSAIQTIVALLLVCVGIFIVNNTSYKKIK